MQAWIPSDWLAELLRGDADLLDYTDARRAVEELRPLLRACPYTAGELGPDMDLACRALAITSYARAGRDVQTLDGHRNIITSLGRMLRVMCHTYRCDVPPPRVSVFAGDVARADCAIDITLAGIEPDPDDEMATAVAHHVRIERALAMAMDTVATGWLTMAGMTPGVLPIHPGEPPRPDLPRPDPDHVALAWDYFCAGMGKGLIVGQAALCLVAAMTPGRQAPNELLDYLYSLGQLQQIWLVAFDQL